MQEASANVIVAGRVLIVECYVGPRAGGEGVQLENPFLVTADGPELPSGSLLSLRQTATEMTRIYPVAVSMIASRARRTALHFAGSLASGWGGAKRRASLSK